MEPVVRLRQLRLPPDSRTVGATLSVADGQATHLLPVTDVVRLLITWLHTLEYQAGDVHVITCPHHGASGLEVELRAGVGPQNQVRVLVPHQRWYDTVSSLIVEVTSLLSSSGASALANPLLEAMMQIAGPTDSGLGPVPRT